MAEYLLAMTMDEIETFLAQAVFYPCSGLDGAPVRFLAKRFPRFLYADCSIDRATFDSVTLDAAKGFCGYRVREISDLDVHSVFGTSWEDIGRTYRKFISAVVQPEWADPFVVLARFDRLPDYGQDHGPQTFDLMFARCEAITTFLSVFSRRRMTPRCFAYIRTGIGFGGNFSTFPTELDRVMRENPVGLPEFILYDGMGGDRRMQDYLPLVEDYERIERWDYKTENYGMGNATLATRRAGNGEPDAAGN